MLQTQMTNNTQILYEGILPCRLTSFESPTLSYIIIRDMLMLIQVFIVQYNKHKLWRLNQEWVLDTTFDCRQKADYQIGISSAFPLSRLDGLDTILLMPIHSVFQAARAWVLGLVFGQDRDDAERVVLRKWRTALWGLGKGSLLGCADTKLFPGAPAQWTGNPGE